jgi:hypothetical protein
VSELLEQKDEIFKALERILHEVKEKLKDVVNPYLIRIQFVINELQNHLQILHSVGDDRTKLKLHWSVIYRGADILDEMTTLIQHTTPIYIKSDADYIKQRLVFLTRDVVGLFGKRESHYIITPKFQELAKLW